MNCVSMNSSKPLSTKFGRSYEVKSSDGEESIGNPPMSDEQKSHETSKRFDMASLPQETRGERLIRRIDIPVQLTRVAILVFIIWIWESRIIFKGLNVLGFDVLPEIIPLFQGVPTEAWDYITDVWNEKLFWQDFWVTLQEALLGFLYGSLSGFLVGMILGRFRLRRKL